MNTSNERQRIDGCDGFSVSAAFIAMEGAGYVRKKYVPTSDVSHLEIYQYICPGGARITLVYDTVAKILTIDAPADEMEKLRPMLPEGAPKKAKQTAPQSQRKPVLRQSRQPAVQPDRQPAVRQSRPPAVRESGRSAVIRGGNAAAVKDADAADKPKPRSEGRTPVVRELSASRARSAKKTAEKRRKPEPTAETLKGVSRKRLDWALKDMKTSDGIKVTAHMGGASWTLSDGEKHTLELRCDGGAVTMTGVPCALTALVRARLTSKCDMRLLRKYLSVSLRYLSEASRVDLSNGLTDFGNINRLSDYSVLLITPYRALEKLIYDLEQAEGINVKMIGQAYEKDEEGNYRLKKGYRKRIGSVVYAEVMSALYTEYYKTRNFYTHSENAADTRSRGISDKAEARRILDNLLSVIEYNCKKLSEINFSVEQD